MGLVVAATAADDDDDDDDEEEAFGISETGICTIRSNLSRYMRLSPTEQIAI